MGKFHKQKSQNKPPRDKSTKQVSKKKFNKKGKQSRNQQNQDTHNEQSNKNSLQNAYGIIDKNKLLAMSSEKQIQTIRDLYNKIIANPEQNIKHLDAMFLLTRVSNLRVVATVLKTMADLFVNIAPLQTISVKTLEQRTETKVTKDQFTVIKFEKVLVEQYERFIKVLKDLRSKLKASDFGSDQEMFTQFKKCLLQCGLTCFNTLWSFNYARELCDFLLNFIKFKQCLKTFRSLLQDKNVATVSIKVKIINGIAQILKKKQDNQLPEDLIRTLNSTYIDGRYLQKDIQTLNFKKKKLKQRIYKQEAFEKKKEKEKGKDQNDRNDKLAQKRQKKTQKLKIKMKIKQEIDKQFAQGEAIISNKEIVRNNSQILQQLFYVYFKILVQRYSSKFLKDALDGILTFAHLINIELISSMIEHLSTAGKIFRQIWKKTPTNQNFEIRLTIVFTMESILNGPLSVYSMDDVGVTSNFYKILRDINSPGQSKSKLNKQVFRLLCITLDQCFIKRRQLSQQIVGSFLRQIIILINRPQFPKLYLLQMIRLIASKYGKVSRMFQEDNQGYGINAYNGVCEDPQSTNAINTQILTQLNGLKKFDKMSKHFEKPILEYISRLSRQYFDRIQGTESLENILKDDLIIGF